LIQKVRISAVECIVVFLTWPDHSMCDEL